jgi:DNA-binding transcriptional ArsR family regulator
MKLSDGDTEVEGEKNRKQTGQPDRAAVFKALSNSRRRLLLSYLLEQNDPVDIKELSRVIAARENGIAPHEVTHEQRKRAYIALYQNHLPFLEKNGLIYSDRSVDGIELADCAPLVRSHLDPPSERPTPLVAADIGIVLLGVVLITLRWAEIYPFSSLPGLAYAAGILIAVAVLSALRWHRVRVG